MSDASKKPSRQQILARLQDVSQQAVGHQTALDAAFAVFETIGEQDSARRIQAQEHLRVLLAEGLGDTGQSHTKPHQGDDTAALGKSDIA